MKLTLEPTEEFFSATNILIRAWRGTDEAGAEVVAFVAGVAIDQETPQPEGLTPVPSPSPDWPADLRALSSAFWTMLTHLSKDEAERALRGALILGDSLLDLRLGFRAITQSWLMDEFPGLTQRIEHLARWATQHAPLNPHETLIVKAMIDRQIAIGPDLTEPPPGDPT